MERKLDRVVIKKRIGNRNQVKTLRQFDCFDPFPEEVEVRDPFLTDISQKIMLITLQVSRIENRLANYETYSCDDLKRPYMLQDPPETQYRFSQNPKAAKKIIKKSQSKIKRKSNDNTTK